MIVQVEGVNDNKLDNAEEVAPLALFSNSLPNDTNVINITSVSNKTFGGFSVLPCHTLTTIETIEKIYVTMVEMDTKTSIDAPLKLFLTNDENLRKNFAPNRNWTYVASTVSINDTK